jgi:hypothetical protein
MTGRVRYVAATLALAVVALGYFMIQGRPVRSGLRLEARPAASRPAAPPQVVPTARAILDRGAELPLTKEQRARLEALDRQWTSESAGLEAAVHQEEEAFAAFMQEAQAGGKTSVQELQRRSADLRELSGTLRERRQQHADSALHILTEQQRRMLSSLDASARHGGV